MKVSSKSLVNKMENRKIPMYYEFVSNTGKKSYRSPVSTEWDTLIPEYTTVCELPKLNATIFNALFAITVMCEHSYPHTIPIHGVKVTLKEYLKEALGDEYSSNRASAAVSTLLISLSRLDLVKIYDGKDIAISEMSIDDIEDVMEMIIDVNKGEYVPVGSKTKYSTIEERADRTVNVEEKEEEMDEIEDVTEVVEVEVEVADNSNKEATDDNEITLDVLMDISKGTKPFFITSDGVIRQHLDKCTVSINNGNIEITYSNSGNDHTIGSDKLTLSLEEAVIKAGMITN